MLDRYRTAAQAVGAQRVLRLTADCPLLDPWVCGQVLALLERSGADYASNVDPRSWPDGLDWRSHEPPWRRPLTPPRDDSIESTSRRTCEPIAVAFGW